jgi:hypothetical protein
MHDVAEAILANLPPLEPVGYRLIIQRTEAGFPTIFEAKAVAAGDRLVYLAHHPHGASNHHTWRARDAPVPPKSEWETLMATTASALKYMMRELLQDVSQNVFVLLMPPHAASDDRLHGREVPVEKYGGYAVGGGDGTDFSERALDEAISALGILRGPVSGPFSWES